MDSINTARDFFINQQGLSPDQADMIIGQGLQAYNQQTQPKSMMQMASGGRIGYGFGNLVKASGVVEPVSGGETSGGGVGNMGLMGRLIQQNPQMFKQIQSSRDFIDRNLNGIDDRQEAAYGGRIGYQMGGSPMGVQAMPMDTGSPLQVNNQSQMPMPNYSSATSITSNPLLNYGQTQLANGGGTPLTMRSGGIARLGYESGGVTIPSQGSELSQLGEMDPAQAIEVITKLLIENGVPPEQAKQLALQIIQIFAQGGEPAVEEFANQLEQQETQAMASGGIAGYGYRQGYFLGGIGRAVSGVVKGVTKAVSGVVKGVANAVKSVVKSDIGKLALLAGGAYLMMNPGILSGLGAGTAAAGAGTTAAQAAALETAGLGGLGASTIAPEVASLGSLQAGTGAGLGVGTTVTGAATTTPPGFFESIGQGFKEFAADPIGKLGQYGSEALDYAKKNKLTTALTAANLVSLGAQLGMPKNENESDEEYAKRLQETQGYLTNYGRNLQIRNPYFYQREGAVNPFAPTMAANGGIMGYAKGGSMVPPARQIEGGIIELDARKTGGYIPYGKKERVDDVPAMLAKDEFVFTSRAVKAAGGGSARRGAAKMYALMKQLESKGARA
jgi:hypothetical protein